MLDLAHDAIIVTNEGGRIAFWSSGAEEIYGWTKDEAMGKTTHRLLRTQFPIPLRDILDKLQHEGRWDGELVHACKDGKQIVAQSRWAIRRDEVGGRIDIMEVNRDITVRRRCRRSPPKGRGLQQKPDRGES